MNVRGSVVGFVGPEGSGKSLAMCAFALMHRAHGLPVLAYPGWYIQDGRDGSPTFGERWSESIDPAQSLLIQNLPRQGGLAIDEAPQFFDSMLFGATTSRLFGQVGTQRRKLDLTIWYTAQNWMHVHPRIRFATHYLIVCRDQYWDPQQREEGRQRGEFINLSCWDVKGFHTGIEWSPMGRATLFAHHYWNYYDTEGIVDASEGLISVKTKKREVVYDMRGADGPRIYRPGEADEDDAPVPPPELATELSVDADLLNRAAEAGANALQLAKLKRGLARGRR